MKIYPITLVETSSTDILESENAYLRIGEDPKHVMISKMLDWIDTGKIKQMVFSIEAGCPIVYIQMENERDYHIMIDMSSK